MESRRKIVVILGPTASGKSEISIKLAKKFNGEIISADSRQIYRGMDIGTGKVAHDAFTSKPRIKNQKSKFTTYYSSGIAHYMIDIVDPKTAYNVAKFKKKANKIIEDILQRKKLPIVCGGTGFWIKAIVDDINFPKVKPDWKLRKELDQKTNLQLFRELKKLDPQRAKTIDKNNKIRLIRAIEICKTLGQVPQSFINNSKRETSTNCKLSDKNLSFLQIGIKIPKDRLHQNIEKRLKKRLKQGMIEEVENLHFKHKVSWKRMESFGLEYKWVALYLQNKISKKEMENILLQEIKNYAKRQITWWKKNSRIIWLSNYENISRKVKNFL